MGVLEEAKERLAGIQCKVQRVYDAGEAVEKGPTNKMAHTKFKIMYATLENLCADFEAQLTVIIRSQCKGGVVGELVDTEKLRAEFEDKYVGSKIFADEYLPEATADASLNKTFMEQKSTTTTSAYFPVEKLSIPIFNGNPIEYTSFRNMFDTMVDNTNMAPVLKFGYLKSRLEGEPLKLIGNLMLTDSNYTLALSQLTSRYSNRRVIAEHHLEQLFNSPKAFLGDGNSIRKLLNNIMETTGALQNLTFAVDQWDPILLHLLQKKLDSHLRSQWELLVDTTEDPTVVEFTTFLTKYCKSATVTESHHPQKPFKQNKTTTLFTSQPGQQHTAQQTSKNESWGEKQAFTCQVCKVNPGHLLINCPLFKDKTPTERHKIIKELNRCFRCFSAHRVVDCKNPKTCKDCGGRHHTMLHLSNTEKTVTAAPATFTATATNSVRTSVLLATATVVVQTKHGSSVNVRALLDSASQSSFVTERCVYLLGLQRENRDVVVQALAGTQVPVVKGSTTINVRPVGLENPQFNVNALILPRITGPIPSERVFTEHWPHTVGLSLADLDYDKPLPVDILLGADVFPQLILGDKRVGNTGQPIALSTVFGWVLMGRTSCATETKIVTMCSTLESVNQTLKRFFEVEEVPNVEKSCPADLECERIYQSTTTRQPDGRYVVHLPFLKNPPQLGQSKDQALNRLYHLENRFTKNPVLREEYNKEMRDYLDTTHMTKLNQTFTNEQNSYYIPHHVVIRPESTTTKMRIVFDASAKTSSGMSLNDNLYCGKKLQQDLPGIILRFRLHPIVFTADIKKMFRQIVVTETHRPYQRLLYRFNPEEPVQEYELNRVTFGQKCSPFIAIRTLHKLVDEEASNDEALKAIVHRDLYVDDIVTGTSNLNEALELTQKLITLFEKGKFELRKWSSNSKQLLTHIPLEHQQVLPITFEERDSGCTKVLGLKWDPKVDSLSYQYQPCPVKFSKRAILSEIARIYDPLGLLTPVTTDLKRLMKYLWLVGVNWDETIPEEAMTSWTQYHRELPVLATLQIPRMVTHPNATYELHGFSDASEAAYAAAVYLRIDTGTEIKCHLLMGKSKIAPAKRISVPRLELCGAWLLARLLAFAQDNLSAIHIGKVTAWSDSTVTLHWIRSSTSRLKTFVANRVSKIQEQTHVENWRHVPTNDNPTDCASRGLRPNLLASHDIWWHGPPFLRQPEREWPVESTLSPNSCSEEENEEKPISLLSQEKEEDCRLLYQSDNLPKVLRLTVYWLRLRDRLRKKPFVPITSPPTTDETDRALRSLVRWTQNVYFSDEKKDLSMDKPARRNLRNLTPFLDDDHLLRVGGRLGYAEIPYNEKHPLLLPKSARLTELLIDSTHRKNGHPGPQTVQYLLRQNYWILSSRSVIKQRIHRCIPCFRAKPRLAQPIMGNLPAFRISQIKPFSRTGVDFAGPFQVKAAMIRKIKVTKAYICIFVCMVTTAVHIELVSDLSTPLFIAALDRFIGRRGRCTDIYSDCGTNFIGTNRYLQEVYSILKGPRCVENAVDNQIRWHFNPPASPHMGGLWEAAVKSTKTLLLRIIQDRVLTYEELNTVLHRVESTLNSRPLSSMSSDPNDFQALTAGHFLTMAPLVSVPAPHDPVELGRMSRSKRWSLIQQIHQHFWIRWQKEYILSLHERSKWTHPKRNLQVGDLVLVSEPSAPLTWPTARVVEVHPGADGIVRVAKVKLSTGKIYTRPSVKLCLLPLTD